MMTEFDNGSTKSHTHKHISVIFTAVLVCLTTRQECQQWIMYNNRVECLSTHYRARGRDEHRYDTLRESAREFEKYRDKSRDDAR